MSFFCDNSAILADLGWIKDQFWQSRQRDARMKEILMALQAEVQALLNAVAEQGDAIAAATDEMVSLETHVAALEAQIGAMTPGAPIDAEDLAAIVTATGTISASIATLKGAMPQPVAPAVVDAVTAPTETPAPEAPPA